MAVVLAMVLLVVVMMVMLVVVMVEVLFSGLTLRRFSEDSVTGMIQDLFMLAKADFTVCSYTSNVGLLLRKSIAPCLEIFRHVLIFSLSQICRMLFELQQARGEDGGHVESLEVFLASVYFVFFLFCVLALCFVYLPTLCVLFLSVCSSALINGKS